MLRSASRPRSFLSFARRPITTCELRSLRASVSRSGNKWRTPSLPPKCSVKSENLTPRRTLTQLTTQALVLAAALSSKVVSAAASKRFGMRAAPPRLLPTSQITCNPSSKNAERLVSCLTLFFFSSTSSFTTSNSRRPKAMRARDFCTPSKSSRTTVSNRK